MKKYFIKTIKLLNWMLNEKTTAEEEADIILKYLLLKNSTSKSIDIFDILEIKFQIEMQNREKQAASVCRLVNSKYKKQAVMMTVNDPIFELPMKKSIGL